MHLKSCLSNDLATSPLALATSSCNPKPSQEARGLQREYLKVLSANITAQKEYEAVSKISVQASTSSSVATPSASDRIEEHLNTVKLQKKQAKLQTVDKYLDLLSQNPAASQHFLEPDEIFKDSAPLPEVPNEVVSGFTVDKGLTTIDLNLLNDRLEKAVLRAKLLLRKEEDFLEAVKSRSQAEPGNVSDVSKVAALNATRNELINWIETELGKASTGDDSEITEEDTASPRKKTSDNGIDDQVESIKERYAQYLLARKSLIQVIGQNTHVLPVPSFEAQGNAPIANPSQHTSHLILPYVERLISLAHEQKASIAQKSHLNITLAKEMKDSSVALDHLAEESQLLLSYPAPGATKKRGGLGDGLGGTEDLDASSRVKRWVFAADSAKIATLETVAEKIEEGQIALEGSMNLMGEINQLLGRKTVEETAPEPSTMEDDIWLAESDTGGKGATSRRHATAHTAKPHEDGGIWSLIDGNLGLINESPARL